MANDLGEPVGDGVVGLADILCAMDGFSTASACTSMDQKPCLQVDGTNDVDDLLVVLDAFGGETYPVSCAAASPPCYAPAAPPPLPALKHNPYYFTGQRLDHDLKNASGETTLALYHYRARAYDPIHGRFLQRDPAEYVDGMSLYEYVRSSPVRGLDPFGLRDWLDKLSDFVAGVGDSLSFGLSRQVRNALEWGVMPALGGPGEWDDPQVHTDSGYYIAGEIVEVTVEIAVTAGGASLRHVAKHSSRRVLTGNVARTFKETRKLEGGIVHHINPIIGHPPGGGQFGGQVARFPLPFEWAARGDWNLRHISTGTRAGDTAAHLQLHRWMMQLESLDRLRTATIVTRQAGNAIFAHSDCVCDDPSITVSATFSGETTPITYGGGSELRGMTDVSGGASLVQSSTIQCHASGR